MKTETEALAGRDYRLVREFGLRVLAGPDKGVAYAARGGRATVGTHPSNDLVLTDRTLSRFHCELTFRDGRMLLLDLGSRNGTEVDGVAIEAAFVQDRSVITAGQSRLRFESGSAELRVELSHHERFGLLLGRSAAMREVFIRLEKMAGTDTTILLEGETGTGKDLAAESIHLASPRRDGSFVVVDCGAIAPNLIESDLFGHERGAFTGANAARAGAFERAHRGTLFLDEIGELPLALQPKLLRALERKEIQRVGGAHCVPVDVRVIAATNRNLRTEVNAKRFRSDLYYRLAVLSVVLPPLRERQEDIALLAGHFIEGSGLPPERIAPLREKAFMAALAAQSWPGNVRELRNYVERYLVWPDSIDMDKTGGSADAPATSFVFDLEVPFRKTRDRWLQRLERTYLELLLEKHGRNASEAMRVSGISRVQFYRMLRRTGLRDGEER